MKIYCANNRRTQAKKKVVVEGNSGDDARDTQAKKDALPSKEGNILRGFGGNGSGKSAAHTQSSASSTADEVIQASENHMPVSGAKVQSERAVLIQQEEALNVVEVGSQSERPLLIEEEEAMKALEVPMVP
jgi:hypothetical protein